MKALILAVLVSFACGGGTTAQQPPTVGTTGTGLSTATPKPPELPDLSARLKAYVELKKEALRGDGKQKETTEPAEIKKRQEALAARIHGLRADAKPGDIFTPETRAAIRRLLAPELKGEDGRDARAMLKDDAPAPGAVPLKINARYPEGAPLATTPANLLLKLPTLPEGLEYRFVGKDLVLLDVDAQIVVDYVRNAIR